MNDSVVYVLSVLLTYDECGYCVCVFVRYYINPVLKALIGFLPLNFNVKRMAVDMDVIPFKIPH